MNEITRALIGSAVILTAALTGCAQQQTVADWQQSARQYVMDEANGDLTALGDVQEREGHRVFATLGSDDPQQGADAVGVFVGQRSIDDQPWMLFIVGQVADRELQSSRLVAVTQENGELIWAMGDETPRATQAYLRHQLMRHDGRPPVTGWPERGDRYRVEVSGPQVRVLEQRSGAMWSLNLAEVEAETTAGLRLSAGPRARPHW